MPAAATTFFQRASSVRITLPISCGVVHVGTVPMASRCLTNAGSVTASFISALILFTTQDTETEPYFLSSRRTLGGA